jgi:hypothetical protein
MLMRIAQIPARSYHTISIIYFLQKSNHFL